MVTRFTAHARSVVKNAEGEARRCRSSVIEAEHLFLAMSAQPDAEVAKLLASVGLTHKSIEDALEKEFAASLQAAGVSVERSRLGGPRVESSGRMRMGASSKAALVRAATAASGSRQIESAHLLIGVLGAHLGTVPRALRLAGVDQADLMART
ncbi:MAG: Clp protease N-terminal domain-containing protein, partial [Candidatus Nanopelagicales bacterium]